MYCTLLLQFVFFNIFIIHCCLLRFCCCYFVAFWCVNKVAERIFSKGTDSILLETWFNRFCVGLDMNNSNWTHHFEIQWGLFLLNHDKYCHDCQNMKMEQKKPYIKCTLISSFEWTTLTPLLLSFMTSLTCLSLQLNSCIG